MKSKLLIAVTFLIFLSCGQTKKSKDDKQEPIVKEQPEKELKSIGEGRITTIADGMDVQRVNLWSSTSGDRTMTSYLINVEEVKILKDEDPYYLVETTNGDGRKGYCMKGFVVINK